MATTLNPTPFSRLLARTAFALAAAIFLASLVFAGAVAGLIWVLWNLLQGRRPTWRFFDLRTSRSWNAARRAPQGFPFGATPDSQPAGEVVEGQAREVGRVDPRLQRD